MKYVIIFCFIIIIIISGCVKQTMDKTPELTEMQITACNSADKAGTCVSKLPELNLVTAKECCESLNKCC